MPWQDIKQKGNQLCIRRYQENIQIWRSTFLEVSSCLLHEEP